jgi:hypothetical protein
MLKTRRLLTEGREQERGFIPFGNRCLQTSRDENAALMDRLNGRIAANVVRVGMGVDQPVQFPPVEGVIDQGNSLFRMGDIAAVDQRCCRTIKGQDVICRKPAAFEDVKRLR